MANRGLHVTDTELAVLQVLWEHGTETARGITEVLYPSCSPSDVATVHSMLKRLEAKRAVRRDRMTHPHGFTALVTKADVASSKLAVLAEQLSDGSMAPLIMQLVRSQMLTKAEADEIREMLKSYKPKRR